MWALVPENSAGRVGALGRGGRGPAQRVGLGLGGRVPFAMGTPFQGPPAGVTSPIRIVGTPIDEKNQDPWGIPRTAALGGIRCDDPHGSAKAFQAVSGALRILGGNGFKHQLRSEPGAEDEVSRRRRRLAG